MDDIIIFANGIMQNPAHEAARWVHHGDCILAADGGTHHVLAAGLLPDHIIGDVDSLDKGLKTRMQGRGTIVHPYSPAKDETDLELALLWAAARAPRQIIILGALGGRPDQALANLLLLALPALKGQRALIADGDWIIRLIRGGENLALRGQPGDRVSLVPLGGDADGVRTQGLAYPLQDETLTFARARGISNVLEGTEAGVAVTRGLVWCFQEGERMGDDEL